MSSIKAINTAKAPAAIGTYSQAIQAGDTLYLSGQIPLDPVSMTLVPGDFKAQITQVFQNLKAVAESAGTNLNRAVKLTIYLTDFANFAIVNEIMQSFFQEPYPARATIQVSALPKGAEVEVDAIIARE